MSRDETKPAISSRSVCDHCWRRRIRCDGNQPCSNCSNASLTCKREHIPKRRGPKRGSGRVLNELRAHDEEADGQASRTYIAEGGSARPGSVDEWLSSASNSPTVGQAQGTSIIQENPKLSEKPRTFSRKESYQPSSPIYFHLIPTCLDLFMEHIYPIMPLIHMPSLLESINRPLQSFEKNLLYSMCALTSTHMMGKSIHAVGPPSWEAAGRFFLDECLLIRQCYDFVEDKTLFAVVSSYFVSTAFFELNQSRKSWYYLREALTMGQDLGFHDERSYMALDPTEALCRRRTFWILYVTERSFAILRHKPLTLQKTPELPSTLHEYENSEIHSGFMQLVHSYHLLDSNFVDSWNESSDAPASTMTYTALQQQLNLPHPSHLQLTDIQKADILVTQQWLRLIVWQSSMRQGLLSSNAEDESMTFCYPLQIANSLLSVISSLPTTSIEVHGMGIFEKIFEIDNSMMDVMQAYGPNIQHEKYGISQDPFELFIKTLSQTPNSQKQYASLLFAKAAEKPEMQRFGSGLRPSLQDPTIVSLFDPQVSEVIPSNTASVPYQSERQWRGSIVAEVDEMDFVKLEKRQDEQPLIHR